TLSAATLGMDFRDTNIPLTRISPVDRLAPATRSRMAARSVTAPGGTNCNGMRVGLINPWASAAPPLSFWGTTPLRMYTDVIVAFLYAFCWAVWSASYAAALA